MIDFNKPLRVVNNHLYPVTFFGTQSLRILNINDVPYVVACDGKCFRLESVESRIENMPPEPVKRYQAQFPRGDTGNWYTYKQYSPGSCPVIAWLIETDHGEGAAERYTYHREEISK